MSLSSEQLGVLQVLAEGGSQVEAEKQEAKAKRELKDLETGLKDLALHYEAQSKTLKFHLDALKKAEKSSRYATSRIPAYKKIVEELDEHFGEDRVAIFAKRAKSKAESALTKLKSIFKA